MALTQKSKITLTDFNPKVIAAQPDDVRRLTLGTLIGRATGVVKRMSPDKSQEFLGLGGAFEAYFAVPDASGKLPEPFASGVLFMDRVFLDPLINIISDRVNEQGVVVHEGADAIQFSMNIVVQRAKNPQGYEWLIEPLFETAPEEKVDPLDEMRKTLLLPNSGVAKVADKLQLAAPAPADKPKK